MLLANNEIIKKVRSFDLNKISADLHNRYEAGIAEDGAVNSRVFTVAGNVATINITGMLTKSYTFMTWLYGGTAYSEIMNALALIENDSEITDVIVKMDSGGGHVAGLFDVVAEIQAMTTPIRCIVSGSCCSAAYAIAAQCDTIEASSNGDSIGSIGIVVDVDIDPEEVSITSTNAPNKRPDATTDEGRAQIRAQLDEYEELFLEAIAEGRGVKVDEVIKNYGQGATTIARNALKSGMIDSINLKPQIVQGDPGNSTTASNEEIITMNAAEIKANHPEAYAAILAEGKQVEQDRVSAFAELGEASGAPELAMAMIKDGTEHSATVNAKFMAAQMKAGVFQAMADDNVDTTVIDQTVTGKTEEEALDEATIAAFDGAKMEHF